MDTLLFVLTSVGDDRESASVFYASYLLVTGDETDRPEIAASIAQLTGGRVTGDQILHPYLEDAPLSLDTLVTELALVGWQARRAMTTFIVEED